LRDSPANTGPSALYLPPPSRAFLVSRLAPSPASRILRIYSAAPTRGPARPRRVFVPEPNLARASGPDVAAADNEPPEAGTLRQIRTDIAGRWDRAASLGPQTLAASNIGTSTDLTRATAPTAAAHVTAVPAQQRRPVVDPVPVPPISIATAAARPRTAAITHPLPPVPAAIAGPALPPPQQPGAEATNSLALPVRPAPAGTHRASGSGGSGGAG
ncbi:hypothetical protein HK405_002160, partial [Cladochytrium tenue]